MRTIQVSEFESQCLEILDKVCRIGEEVTILEGGRPVARLLPAATPQGKYPQESLQGTVKIDGDIIAPIVERK